MAPVDSDEQDLTRKQRREQARADRKAAEEAAASGAARRRRLTQLGGALAVVVVAIIVILIATGGGSSSSGPAPAPHSKQASAAQKTVEEELAGIPQKGNTIGNPNAPVTIQYFGDLECPICKDFTLGALPSIMQNWVRTGKVKIEYRSLQTATREPETFGNQQAAALAAGLQNRAWNYIELFYHEQGQEGSGYVTEKYLQGLAQQVPGLNLSKWSEDRGKNSLQAQIALDAQEANNQGFTGTPSFLIGPSGGPYKKLEWNSVTDPKPFEEAIEQQGVKP